MNYEDIKKLINDMGDSKIDSIDIEFPDGIKIKMEKNTHSTIIPNINQQVNDMVSVNTNNNLNNTVNEELDENINIIKSPMVGTFYASSSPSQSPFVKIGDKVKKGDVLCIVEAMKLMNEIESECDGEIIQVCVENENMVEYGTPLFKIKSN